jgi:hypothetical protein
MAIGVSFQDVYIITHQKFVSAIITSVQNPPDGPFSSKDLIWHVFKHVSGQKEGGAIWKVQIAYISNQWIQDFMDGRKCTFQIYKEKVQDKQSWESQIFTHEQLP